MYENTRKNNVFEHVEAKHVESPGYNCSVCMLFCKTFYAYKGHFKRNHRNEICLVSVYWFISYDTFLVTQFNLLKNMEILKFSPTCKRQLQDPGSAWFVITLPATRPTCTSILKQSMFKQMVIIVHTAQGFALISSR